MRKITAVVVLAMAIICSASITFAEDDVTVEVRNGNDITNSATGGNANQNQNQDQKQKQDQSASAVIHGNLPSVGFNSFLNPGNGMEGDGWKVICSEVYKDWSMDEIENARRKFGFLDFITFNWGSNMEFTLVGKPLPENSNPVSCLNYWPKWESHKGDRILGSVVITGEPNTPDEAFIAQAYAVCKKETGSSWVAMIGENDSDSVTTGASFNLSGAISKITGGGDSGNAVASGIGFGKARVRTEKHMQMYALCMNDRRTAYTTPPISVPAPTPPIVKAAPPKAEPPCDTDVIRKRIEELKREVQKCTRYCYNNLTLRNALGDAYIELYTCTGEKKHLKEASYNYGVAERNYRNGHDISAHRVEADQVIAQVYYNWAGCKSILEGRKAAMAFAKAKKLERIPTVFTR